MTGHKRVPPSSWDDDNDKPRHEPVSDRFKRVYDEEMKKPPKKYSLKVRILSSVIGMLLGFILLAGLFGLLVLLVQWIAGMLQ